MKEPVLVALVIVQPWNLESQLMEIKLPLKKINLFCTITKDRFLRFLLKLDILQEEDINFVCFQFYDHSQQAFVSEKQVFDSNNNLYQFSEIFLGQPEELMLKTYILYENNFSNFKQLDQTIQQFEQELEHVKQDQEQIRKQIDEQNLKFQKMREDLNCVQGLANQQTNKILKKQADVVILYSNPLISAQNDIREALFMDYGSEINEIVKSIQESGKQIKYEILQATLSNLDIALSQNPVVLHLILHGDFDVVGAGLYFEFQEDGIVKRLYTNQLQEIIDYNQRKLKRIKIICVSSMIAHEIVPYLQVRLQSVQFVVCQKLFNTIDEFTNGFWKQFYDHIFLGQSVEISYKFALNQIKFPFLKSYDHSNPSVKICCCHHLHDKQCPYDPQRIGYEKSHSSHIKCLKQQFKHQNCDRINKIDDLNQCQQNCLGLIYHSKSNKNCLLKKDKCIQYEEIYQNIVNEFKFIFQHEQLDDVDFDYIRLYIDILDKKGADRGCCCEITNVFQDKIAEKIKISQYKTSNTMQHLIENKFKLYSTVQDDKLKFEENGYSEIQEYFKINNQIIVIHSKNYCNINYNNPILRILFNYFEKYLQCTNKQLITYPPEYGLCHQSKWQVEIQLNFLITEAHEQIKNKENQQFLIVVLQKIDQLCENPQFVQQIQELQKDMKQNTIIILGLSNKSKEKIIDFICEQKLQIIDYDFVESYSSNQKKI